MTTSSQHPSTSDSSVPTNAPSGEAAVAPTPLPDVAKMRAELERLMGKPAAPGDGKEQDGTPGKQL